MKQKYLILALFILSISACSTVKFETSQPKDAEELNEFPPDMIGKYTSMNKDTLIINNNSFQYLEASIFGPGKVNLLKHDEVVLKKSDDNLLLNIKDSNVWEVLLIKHKGSKLTLACIFYDKKNVNDIVNSVKAITNVTAIKDREGNIDKYMINPSKEEFQLLLDKKIFSKIMEYKLIK